MGLSKSKAKLKGHLKDLTKGLSKDQNGAKLILTDRHGETHVLKISKPRPGATLLDIAVENSVDLPHSCGGMGTCGTCRVRLEVQHGAAPERGDHEAEMAAERGFAPDERLSCQIELPSGDFSWSAEALGAPDEEW